jgi:hypothetical protein
MAAVTESARQPEPEPEVELRPWEAEGQVRRDAAPHRGNWLRVFGTLALLLGIVASGCFFFVILSLPFGVVMWRLAAQDLAKMRGGQMDPNGEKETRDALTCAKVAVFIPFAGLLIWATFFLVAQLFRP